MPDVEDITNIVGSGGDTAEPVRGSKLYPCSKCGRLVWLAPTGQAMVRAGALVLCIPDALQQTEPGAREEVLTELMHRRSRN